MHVGVRSGAGRRRGFGRWWHDQIGDQQLRDLLFTCQAREREPTDLVEDDAVGQLIGDQLGRGLRHEHLPTAGQPSNARGTAHRGTEVVALLLLRFTRVHPRAHDEPDAVRERLHRERALERDRGRGGIAGTRERGERAVTLTLRARHPTAVPFGDLGRELVVTRHHLRHRLRVRLPERGGTLDVGEHERDDAGGQRDLACALQSLDQLRRGRRPPRRVRIQRAAQHAVETLGELGRHAVPHDRVARLRLVPGEQPRDRARQHEHVVGDRRGRRVPQRRRAEHEHRATLVGDHDVGETHVAVHDTRPLRVEMIERRRDVGQPAENRGEGEPGIAPLGQELRRRGALDPVDDEHVAIVEQHVVAHRGHGGVGLEPEEQPTFLEERRGVVAGVEPGDLEADGALVAAIDGTGHFGARAGPEDLEHLVATADDVPHWRRVYEAAPNRGPAGRDGIGTPSGMNATSGANRSVAAHPLRKLAVVRVRRVKGARHDHDAGGDRALLDAKAALRERVWADLDHPGVARFPKPANRIPNFVGAEAAARRLADTAEWAGAATVKSNPDSPQWPVRQRALVDGKVVYMAVPRLAEADPFFLLDPAQLVDSPRTASSIKGASRSARTVDVGELEPVDLVVTGCVAVDSSGARLGKGGGFSDLELAVAAEAGLVDVRTIVVTTVHELQVLTAGIVPTTEHDIHVDIVVTPDRVVRCPRPPQWELPRLRWDDLTEEKIAADSTAGPVARDRECLACVSHGRFPPAADLREPAARVDEHCTAGDGPRVRTRGCRDGALRGHGGSSPLQPGRRCRAAASGGRRAARRDRRGRRGAVLDTGVRGCAPRFVQEPPRLDDRRRRDLREAGRVDQRVRAGPSHHAYESLARRARLRRHTHRRRGVRAHPGRTPRGRS